jgi:mannosyltransferase OCH1-like enzyme
MNRQITYNRETPVLYIVSGVFNPEAPVFKEIRRVTPERLYLASLPADIKAVEPAIDWECRIKLLQNNKQSAYPEFVFQAVSWFFNHEPEGIVLEDYYQPLEGFFGFCSTMLERYRNDDRIGHISGKDYRRKKGKTDYSYRFSSLVDTCGWASWRRSWQEVKAALKTYPNFRKSSLLANISAFRPFKNQWQKQFDRYLHGRENGFWQIRYQYSLLINGRLSVVPESALVNDLFKPEQNANPDNSLQENTFTHPPFIIGDTLADWEAQEILFNVPALTENRPDGFSQMRDKLLSLSLKTGDRLKIPRIIHQIYEDPAGSPETLLYMADTWKKHHPGWTYRFWNKQATENFLTTHFPDFIACYRSFPFDVQRWDAIRYLILYQMGGLYVDFDYECIRPLDALLLDTTCCMGMEPSVNANLYNKSRIIGNALMASIPGHNYFKAIIREMKDYQGTYKGDADRIMETTGPFMVTRVYEKYKRKKEVTLLSADLVAPLTVRETRLIVRGRAPEEIVEKAEKAFAVHYFGGSWVEQINRRK